MVITDKCSAYYVFATIYEVVTMIMNIIDRILGIGESELLIIATEWN